MFCVDQAKNDHESCGFFFNNGSLSRGYLLSGKLSKSVKVDGLGHWSSKCLNLIKLCSKYISNNVQNHYDNRHKYDFVGILFRKIKNK